MYFIGQRDKVGMIWFDFEHVKKERCALLERGGAPTCEPTHYVIGGSTLSTSYPHVSTHGSLWDKWQPHLNTWHLLLLQVVRPSSPSGAPSSSPISSSFAIYWRVVSHCILVGALGRIVGVIILIVLSFYIGIKKGFGGKLGVDLMCGCSLSCTNFWGEIVLMHFFQLIKL